MGWFWFWFLDTDLPLNRTFLLEFCGHLWTYHRIVCTLVPCTLFVATSILFLTAVVVSRSLLLTARVTEGSQVQIISVPGKAVHGAGYWLPSLQNIREAKLVRIRETHRYTAAEKSTPLPRRQEDEKVRSWLTLVLREHLSKYRLHARPVF